MDEYLFQVVVPKALAPSHLIKLLETEKPIVLPAWGASSFTSPFPHRSPFSTDPMGSLA